MGNDPTDIWSWVAESIDEFREEGGLKEKVADSYLDFYRSGSRNPAAAELAINQALETAKTLGDVRWELFLRHWRIQHWLRQNEVKRILPEAIDLLDLALDERVKGVPQRICAYHDVVECYLKIDGAGYYEEISENAKHILAQLPQRHPCATCARLNMANASSVAGHAQEALEWETQCEANLTQKKYDEFLLTLGDVHENLQDWSTAERHFQEACELAMKEDKGQPYLEALLGLARARLGLKKFPAALRNLEQARQGIKFEGSPALIARLNEVEGVLAEIQQDVPSALASFTQAGSIYLQLGTYRQAALNSLHAAELAASLPAHDASEALTNAAKAVGAMPPASRDVYTRLAALGQEPVAPVPDRLATPESQDEQAINAREFEALEAILRAYIARNDATNTATMLHRLGIWQVEHHAQRAAIDYFLGSAALERLLKLPQRERSVALQSLRHVKEKLPAGTLEAALQATQDSPMPLLTPLLTHVPAEQWRWTLQALATEVTGKPVVEPEPEGGDPRQRFEEMIEHNASMTALLVRFHAQADADKREAWIAGIAEGIQHMEELIAQNAENNPPKELLSFMHGLVALARGTSIAEVQPTVLAPFDRIIAQIGQIAALPVWQHPGNTPLDFLIEQAAQRAVRALRIHDEHHSTRLANLVFRYQLMTIDMRQHPELANEVAYLDALCALLQNDGQLPTDQSALAEPFATILVAAAQAGKEQEVVE